MEKFKPVGEASVSRAILNHFCDQLNCYIESDQVADQILKERFEVKSANRKTEREAVLV